MRQFDIREPSIAALEAAPIYFRYGANKRRVLVDKLTADAVLSCYRAVNADNRAKFARMVTGTPKQFERLVSFCWRHVKIGS